MSELARYLQGAFREACPEGWECVAEAPVAQRELVPPLGFAPRADLLLRRADGSRRIWIELEVSRADPAANQVKFGVLHLFMPFSDSDAFVSMVSRHVASGRRNLASASALLLRRAGMTAFQTCLLPGVPAEDIKRLNHSDRATIDAAHLDVATERDRVLAITERQGEWRGLDIHFASNLMEVRWSVRNWTREISEPGGRDVWGTRTVRYFVCDEAAHAFAPSKFCAYVAIPRRSTDADAVAVAGPSSVAVPMRIPIYAEIHQGLRIFDGNRAWRHLTRFLGMRLEPLADASGDLRDGFARWQRGVRDAIRVHPRGPVLVRFPEWFS